MPGETVQKGVDPPPLPGHDYGANRRPVATVTHRETAVDRRTRLTLVGLAVCAHLAFGAVVAHGEDAQRALAVGAMAKATAFLRTEVATRGGYLWQYTSDLSMREGEGPASPTTIWVQPPGTPTIGMTFLSAYEATGDSRYLDAARDAANALVWGQLASGGWDYRIDFDPERAKRWYTRRDALSGQAARDRQRNTTVLDDNTTQSALRLLMRVDQATGFADPEVHDAAMYALSALVAAQFPNGAWPQRFSGPPDAEDFPVKPAQYPETWSRTFPRERYSAYYTFNDNAMSDMADVMLEASHTYSDTSYLTAARRVGAFMIQAQMPEPQPAWAQQYNADMEPAWARWFEPPAITGGESFGVMRTLMNLYLETGEERFLDPIPRALAWAKRSRLPDGRLARFYELQTNRPLYFTPDREMTYSDTNLRPGYAFKQSGSRIDRAQAEYERIQSVGREALLAERKRPPSRPPDPARVREVIQALDPRGRWVEAGEMRHPEDRGKRISAEVISCRTFARNMAVLIGYLAAERGAE